MTKILIRLRQRTMDGGATMVEYGVMVAFIAVVVMGVVKILGGDIAGLFQDVINAL